MIDLGALRRGLVGVPTCRASGRLLDAVGPVLEAELPGVAVGSLCEAGPGRLCEVVGFRGRRALLMPLVDIDGVAFGTEVTAKEGSITVPVGEELLGRVLDGLGRPMDGGPPLRSVRRRALYASAPDPLHRGRVREPLHTGVRVLDGLMSLGLGQRIGIMAGSGVGKSTLLGMLARNMRADIAVICLIGERGREVREFLEDNLGPEGLKRSVVVVATSEQSPAMQVKSAFTATAIAEGFRDQGHNVLLLVDSLTRMALAQRQIGLASGEPPTTRGFTPSVFAQLPRLLERAGPGEVGSITGIYTVLVEGDDTNDPIGDAVRGIVDGHVVLSRALASRGHFPAVDVLGSLSRLMATVAQPAHKEAARAVRELMAIYAENEELLRLGAYRKGTSAEVDRAIDRNPEILAFLRQDPAQRSEFATTVGQLANLARR